MKKYKTEGERTQTETTHAQIGFLFLQYMIMKYTYICTYVWAFIVDAPYECCTVKCCWCSV